jgi:hypothetical protein
MTTPPPSSSTSLSTTVDILEQILRPIEITSCTWMNHDASDNRILPHTCACYDIPNQEACANGYRDVRRGSGHDVFEKTPNTLISWCLTNVPSQYSNDDIARNSWVTGCFNGIRGPHKKI